MYWDSSEANISKWTPNIDPNELNHTNYMEPRASLRESFQIEWIFHEFFLNFCLLK